MKKTNKIIPFLPVALLSMVSLAGCNSETKEMRYLRVLNCEDYIYEAEKEGWWCDACEDYIDEKDVTVNEESGIATCNECGEEVSWDMDLMDQFVEYWEEETGEKIGYVYDTFDTNETMFNELKTGKTTYDVIVPSDYMIQKLIANDMLHKISEDRVEDLWANISPFLAEKFENIHATNKATEEDAILYDYAVPYMWGTVGVMYNPSYYADKLDIEEEEVHEDFLSWDTLYSEKYEGTFSIKDSVRDTYAVSIVHAYADEIAEVTDNETLTEIFNRHDDDTIALVKEDMLKLKDNAFGFECDSGKTDMTTQKIGANMCWSGDATWAISVAEDPSLDGGSEDDDSLILYYSIPTGVDGKEASNIWFDGLCMPNNGEGEEAEAQYELAEAFIEFMCDPEIAAENCDCIGYTPGVAGDAMLDYIYDCYDVRGEVDGEIDPEWIEGEDYVLYDISYFYDGSLDEYETVADAGVLYADPEVVGRQLNAQYPEGSILDRLAIMNDFGDEGNAKLLDMWESVRTNPLPGWAVALLVIEVIIGLGFAGYIISKKVTRKHLKKSRA